MKVKSLTLGVLLVMVLGLLAGAGSAFAASPAAGSGPDSAATPQADWQTLAVGQRMWYAFNYAGDGSQMDITMQVDPTGSVNFGVWTPDELKSWQATGAESPIGRGTPNDELGGALNWSGNFPIAGTYYVVVDQAGNTPGNYQLAITGSGVSFPAAAPTAKATAAATTQVAAARQAGTTETAKEETGEIAKAEGAETAAVAKAETAKTETTAEQAKETAKTETTEVKATAAQNAQATTATAAVPAGTGPDNAIPATGNDQGKALQPGQVRWYVFQATGGDAQILVRLTSDPAGAATFSLWTQDELQQLANTGVENPVGRSTPNDQYNGDQFWAGGFTDAGKYFIRVEQNGTAPVNSYQLQITQ